MCYVSSRPCGCEKATYGSTSILTIGLPAQYSTVRRSPLRIAVVRARFAVRYR